MLPSHTFCFLLDLSSEQQVCAEMQELQNQHPSPVPGLRGVPEVFWQNCELRLGFNCPGDVSVVAPSVGAMMPAIFSPPSASWFPKGLQLSSVQQSAERHGVTAVALL